MNRPYFFDFTPFVVVALSFAACGGQAIDPSPGADGPDAGPAATSSAPVGGSPSPNGVTTFRMVTAAAGAGYVYASSFADPGDGVWWYSVATAAGEPLDIFMDGQIPSCSTCGSKGAAIGSLCDALPPAGVTASWDGFVALEGTSTCGAGTSCIPYAYAAAGDYVVTMCAGCAGLEQDAASPCISVPFHYPSGEEVVGTLP